jgi:hypothetical protein
MYSLGFSSGTIETVEMKGNRDSELRSTPKIPAASFTCTERNKWNRNRSVVPIYFILDIAVPFYMVLL